MNQGRLFSPLTYNHLFLKNRVVMAPLTRCRAIDHLPNELMATYYGQRASCGLIISEGTAPSPSGCGYARMPGIYSNEQIEKWKLVTDEVHANGGKIFVQLMHTGRVSHPLNMPENGQALSPADIFIKDKKLYVDGQGPCRIPPPIVMSALDIENTVQEYIHAVSNAIEAGFDGIELHGANGYLIEQFINPKINTRTDHWGGSLRNRSHFLLQIVERIRSLWPTLPIGVRLSPNSTFNEMPLYADIDLTYRYLAKSLSGLDVTYIHLVDHESWGLPVVPRSLQDDIRADFSGLLILSGGYNQFRAEDDLSKIRADLIAFGRPFISNPDLVERMKNLWPMTIPDKQTFYSSGVDGYIDYPFYK